MSKSANELSPRSGRPTIAQRFIAGDERPNCLGRVREADGRNNPVMNIPSILPPVSRAAVHFWSQPQH
jgi:hypothetical protein